MYDGGPHGIIAAGPVVCLVPAAAHPWLTAAWPDGDVAAAFEDGLLHLAEGFGDADLRGGRPRS